MYYKKLYACINVKYSSHTPFLSVLLLYLLSSLLSVTAASKDVPGVPWHYAEQGIMGTVITIKFQHADKKIAHQASQEVFKLMWDINNEMSNYKSDSLLSKINKTAHIKPVKISDRLFGLITKSLYYSRISNGAFDITVGTIGQHYNFRKKERPTDTLINEKLKYVSYKNIQLDPTNKTIFINNKYAQLDLGGIAKGYAIALAIELLKKYKIKNAYISAGGDSYAIGTRNNRPWHIAIKNPRKGENNIIIPVSDIAISTSGDYERYFEEDNVRYHHIINPTTGHSAKKSVSVTVLGNSPVDTDALSTTLFVLGEKKGIELIDQIDGYDAIYVYPNGKMTFSNGLKRE